MSKKVKDYTLHEEIGRDQVYVWYRATRDTGNEQFICQAYPKHGAASKALEKYKQGANLHMVLLENDHIRKVHCVVETANNHYMFMEYCKDGDLQGKLNKHKKLVESEALYYLKQIMSGLKYLVDRGIMHRDIKPANFLIHNDQLKLTEFGMACKEKTSTEILEHYEYTAPEASYNCESPYDNKIDIWSVGLVYYQMLFGAHPFDSMSLEQLQSKIRVHEALGRLLFPEDVPVSEYSRGLLNKMLKVNPQNRATWDEVFSHPVFSQDHPSPDSPAPKENQNLDRSQEV